MNRSEVVVQQVQLGDRLGRGLRPGRVTKPLPPVRGQRVEHGIAVGVADPGDAYAVWAAGVGAVHQVPGLCGQPWQPGGVQRHRQVQRQQHRPGRARGPQLLHIRVTDHHSLPRPRRGGMRLVPA